MESVELRARLNFRAPADTNADCPAAERKLMTKGNLVERLTVAVFVCLTALFMAGPAWAQVKVSQTQGIGQAFLLVRTMDGELVGDGDFSQIARGNRVTAHIVLRFKDGSVQDETTVYSQRGRFIVLSDHLIQKGPQFKTPMDVVTDRASGTVTVNYTDTDGKQKTTTDEEKLPLDLANGIVATMLQEVQPSVGKMTASMIVATPKPRLVKLVITPVEEDGFAVGASRYKAEEYNIHIDLTGVAGVVAPIVGKEPPDTHVWIYQGNSPLFVKSEGPQYEGGPIWQIELAGLTWPAESPTESK
jgi:hypothetical protein